MPAIYLSKTYHWIGLSNLKVFIMIIQMLLSFFEITYKRKNRSFKANNVIGTNNFIKLGLYTFWTSKTYILPVSNLFDLYLEDFQLHLQLFGNTIIIKKVEVVFILVLAYRVQILWVKWLKTHLCTTKCMWLLLNIFWLFRIIILYI